MIGSRLLIQRPILNWRRTLVLCLLVTVAGSLGVILGESAAVATSASGNKAAIAFYKKVVTATSSMGGGELRYLVSAPIDQVTQNKSATNWLIERPPTAGYAPAESVVSYGAFRGRVQFVADTVVYDGRGKAFNPFGMLLTAKGEVMLGGGATTNTVPPGRARIMQPCVGPTHGSVYVGGYTRVGGPSGYGLYGHFLAMRRSGPNMIVTSQFEWSTKPLRTATEIDVIKIATHLPVSGTEHISRASGEKGAAGSAFTMHWINSWSKALLYPPNTNGACAAYIKGVR